MSGILDNPPGLKPLASVSLTHVQFDENDPYGAIMAYASLSPIAIIISYCTLIAFRRDVATIFLLIGQLSNEAVNFSAKKIIREARPTEYLGKGYGMPSSHAQFVSFFAVYLTIYSIRRLTFRNLAWKPLISLSVLSLALLVAYSRVHLTYHSPRQVIVGIIVGSVFAGIWFALTDAIFLPALNLNHPVARWLLLKDTRDIPNILDFEYRAAVRELDSRQSLKKK
ncbi:dolichyldiphosphatase 1-like protein [Phlyctochytrium arcticum]|nr:dolichyldiphosphatase 1-like protein [Phlyctochytrium arcticum]